jgi:hypothetical protein
LFVDARVKQAVDTAVSDGMARCLDETKSAVDIMGGELFRRQLVTMNKEVNESVSLSVASAMEEVRSSFRALSSSQSESVEEQVELSAQQKIAAVAEQLQKEQLAAAQHHRENLEQAMATLLESKFNSLGVELEGRIDKRLEKRLTSFIEKRLKTHDASSDSGTEVFMLCHFDYVVEGLLFVLQRRGPVLIEKVLLANALACVQNNQGLLLRNLARKCLKGSSK